MITIYGHQRCGWCIKAKALAESHNMKYQWLDTDTPETLTELKTRYPEAKTVPQIWHDAAHIGGYDDFALYLENTAGAYGQGAF